MEQAIADHQCHDDENGEDAPTEVREEFACDGDRHSWLKSRGRKFEQAIVDDENSTCEDVIQ